MKRQIQKKQSSNNSQPYQIKSFDGYYSFLNNDHPSWVQLDGILFPSVTTAFQAARSNDINIRKNISDVTDVQEFKKIVMSIKNPPDWNEKRYHIMLNLVRDKFKRNKQLSEKLLSTKDKRLMNNLKRNGINEQYWGIVEGNGRNILGKITMLVRQQFMKGQDTKKWIQTLKLEKNIKMYPKVSLLIEKGTKKIDKLFLEQKNSFIFGKSKNCDFELQNTSISRYHSCIYFSCQTQVILIDLNSTHGTFLNKQRLQTLIQYKVNKDDIIQFGTSQRSYKIDIDWSQMQKYLKQTQNQLRQQIQRNKLDNVSLQYQKLSRDDVKNYLGIEEKCIMIQGYIQNFNQIEKQIQKYCKIKKIRKVIDKKRGKILSTILFFNSSSQVNQIWKNTTQLRNNLKIKKYSQKQSYQLLNQQHIQRQRSRESFKQHL